MQQTDYARGGSQLDENGVYQAPLHPDDLLASVPYNEMRQQQNEQMHHHFLFADEITAPSSMQSPAKR